MRFLRPKFVRPLVLNSNSPWVRSRLSPQYERNNGRRYTMQHQEIARSPFAKRISKEEQRESRVRTKEQPKNTWQTYYRICTITSRFVGSL
jgi:hypothetical protein